MTPQAAPIGDLAPDEDPQVFAPSSTANNNNLPTLFDPEGGDDYGNDWDDDERFTVSLLSQDMFNILTHQACRSTYSLGIFNASSCLCSLVKGLTKHCCYECISGTTLC